MKYATLKLMNFALITICMIVLVSCQSTKESKKVLPVTKQKSTTKAGGKVVTKSEIKTSSSDFSKGLVAEWKLAGNAKDSAGANDGKAENLVFKKEGEFSFGVFNGKDSVIKVTPKTPLIKGKKFTVSAWIKRTGKLEKPYTALIIGRSGYYNGWRLMVSDDQKEKDVTKNRATIQIGAKKGGKSATSYRISLKDEKWNHIVGIWDGVWLKIYVNSQLGYGTHYAGKYLPAKGWLGIGYNANGIGHFNGCIGDVRIWNRTLKRSEIKALYNEGINRLTKK